MQKKQVLFLALFFISSPSLFSQCLVEPIPAACTGAEPSVFDNEVINKGTTKWYTGTTVTMNSLTMNGGTLIVCGNLIIDKFYMDSGSIYIRPGGRFVIGSGIGAGLQLRGNSSIINYGTLEVQRNLSLDNGWATADKPNRVVNATSSSVFSMANQYLVINNPYSTVVNNGSLVCWGIITDNFAVAGSVCLGSTSTTKMAILINKIANAFRVPTGAACVNVYQWSQFYGRLTPDPGLFACVGSGHTSDASCTPWGCQPNNWGDAQVFTACADCAAIAVLPVEFLSIQASRKDENSHIVRWQTNGVTGPAIFRIERSADGIHYESIDSLRLDNATSQQFQIIDHHPLQGNNFYMIRFINPLTGLTIQSRAVKVVAEPRESLTIFPVPFNNKFTISYSPGKYPERVMLTDITGRNIRIRCYANESTRSVLVTLVDNIPDDMYIVHMQTKDGAVSRTVLKTSRE